jgi:putative transposase
VKGRTKLPGPQPPALQLTSKQQALLQQFAHRKTLSHQLVQRSQMILAMAVGANNSQIAQQLGLTRGTVRSWRQRWLVAVPVLQAAEQDPEQDPVLPELLATLLSDQPRSGAPVTFEPEQIVQIVALACEPPADSGRPVTHWTPTELAQEAVKRGIVPHISARSVGRFLG